jgi:hypothetical protein
MAASAKLRIQNIRRCKPRPLALANQPETREEIDYSIRRRDGYDVANNHQEILALIFLRA